MHFINEITVLNPSLVKYHINFNYQQLQYSICLNISLISVFSEYVIFQVVFAGRTMWTIRAGKWFLPSVNSNMSPQVVPLAESLATHPTQILGSLAWPRNCPEAAHKAPPHLQHQSKKRLVGCLTLD